MKTFKEILEEEFPSNYVDDLFNDLEPIERAAIRFANQETQELQAKLLLFRHTGIPEDIKAHYDAFFSITTERGPPKRKQKPFEEPW
jgi:hypothetical protein